MHAREMTKRPTDRVPCPRAVRPSWNITLEKGLAPIGFTPNGTARYRCPCCFRGRNNTDEMRICGVCDGTGELSSHEYQSLCLRLFSALGFAP